jgi:hypothetical protein
MKEKKLSLSKITEIILKTLLVILVIALPYVFGFWGYTFLTGFFTFLPQFTFWQFVLVSIAIGFVISIFK